MIDPIDADAIKRMAYAWHGITDHAKDGAKFRKSLMCNCDQIARRAYLELGWRDDG